MKKIQPSLSVSVLISQLISAYFAYYLLLTENRAHCSIAKVIEYAHRLPVTKHLLLLGLLPIYIATIIFGLSIIFATAGHWLEKQISRAMRQKKAKIQLKGQI